MLALPIARPSCDFNSALTLLGPLFMNELPAPALQRLSSAGLALVNSSLRKGALNDASWPSFSSALASFNFSAEIT